MQVVPAHPDDAFRGRQQAEQQLDQGGLAAAKVMRWLRDAAISPAFIAPGSPWQDDFVESFNGKLRDELLNREWSRSHAEARC